MKFKKGQRVRMARVMEDHEDHDIGEVVGWYDDGILMVRWLGAGETYDEDPEDLVLAEEEES